MKLKTFRTLQYNITCILHKNSSNRMFCSIHDFTFLVTQKTLRTSLFWVFRKLLPVLFLVKFVMLPTRSIAMANWFACMPPCKSVIVQISLTSLESVDITWRLTKWYPVKLLIVIAFLVKVCQNLKEEFGAWYLWGKIKPLTQHIAGGLTQAWPQKFMLVFNFYETFKWLW